MSAGAPMVGPDGGPMVGPAGGPQVSDGAGNECCCGDEPTPCENGWRQLYDCITDAPTGLWMHTDDIEGDVYLWFGECFYFDDCEEEIPGSPMDLGGEWFAACSACEKAACGFCNPDLPNAMTVTYAGVDPYEYTEIFSGGSHFWGVTWFDGDPNQTVAILWDGANCRYVGSVPIDHFKVVHMSEGSYAAWVAGGRGDPEPFGDVNGGLQYATTTLTAVWTGGGVSLYTPNGAFGIFETDLTNLPAPDPDGCLYGDFTQNAPNMATAFVGTAAVA